MSDEVELGSADDADGLRDIEKQQKAIDSARGQNSEELFHQHIQMGSEREALSSRHTDRAAHATGSVLTDSQAPDSDSRSPGGVPTPPETMSAAVEDAGCGPTKADPEPPPEVVLLRLDGNSSESGEPLTYQLVDERGAPYQHPQLKIVDDQVVLRGDVEPRDLPESPFALNVEVVDPAGNVSIESVEVAVGAESTADDTDVSVESEAVIDSGTGASSGPIVDTDTDTDTNTETESDADQPPAEVNSVTGTSRSEQIDGTNANDEIRGLSGHDRLNGSAGDDTLIGGLHNDTLDGGEGDDTLVGGSGNDLMRGQAGDDLFVFGAGSGDDMVSGGEGWTDVLKIDHPAGEEIPWSIEVEGELVDYDAAAHALELDPDSAGTVTFEDGSSISFEGIERVEW